MIEVGGLSNAFGKVIITFSDLPYVAYDFSIWFRGFVLVTPSIPVCTYTFELMA